MHRADKPQQINRERRRNQTGSGYKLPPAQTPVSYTHLKTVITHLFYINHSVHGFSDLIHTHVWLFFDSLFILLQILSNL